MAKITYYITEAFAVSRSGQAVDAYLKGRSISEEMRARVDYCCKLDQPFSLTDKAVAVGDFKRGKSFVYYADTRRVIRHFPKEVRFEYIFGDVTYVPETPSFVKSRPVSDDNANAVLLKLDAYRHFQFYQDPYQFKDKKPQAIWRGMVYQPHRRAFVDLFYNSTLADVGHNDATLAHEPSYKGFMSIQQQFAYRYILSVEGKDVATNLKWAMASNSLVMMRKPRYETWFLEGRLEPGKHYVLLKDDYSDLEEQIAYYNEHPGEAQAIIANAHQYVAQFLDAEQEQTVALLVAQKYFDLQKSAN
nr:glycosyltransferase family 90 protein [Marinomonas ostreistagni]